MVTNEIKMRGEIMNLRKQHIGLILFAALVLGFLGAYIGIQVGNTSNSNETQEEQIEEESSLPDTGHIPAEQMQKFEMAYELINQHYLEDMESDVLIEG